jgi:hypothetical protein
MRIGVFERGHPTHAPNYVTNIPTRLDDMDYDDEIIEGR